MRPFLTHYALTGNVSEACRRVNISRQTVRHHRQADEQFALAYADAQESAADLLEQLAWRWATVGVPTDDVDETVDATGRITRRTTKRTTNLSPTLLIFLLKGLRPEKYRENYRVEQTGPGGGPIQVEATNIADLFEREIERLTGD